VPLSHFLSLRRVYLTSGNALAVNCWRQRAESTHPAHFLMGHGRLFAAAVTPSVPRHATTLMFHQCGHQPHGVGVGARPWAWALGVWTLIELKASETSLWSALDVNTVVLSHRPTTSGVDGVPLGLPAADDVVVCARSVVFEPRHVTKYFGANEASIVAAWRRHISHWSYGTTTEGHTPWLDPALVWPPLDNHAHHPAEDGYMYTLTTALTPVSSAANRSDDKALGDRAILNHYRPAQQTSSSPHHPQRRRIAALGRAAPNCSHNLQVAVWERGAGQFGSRRILNIEQLRALVAEYSTRPLRLLTASSYTSFALQVARFRSFDILITPHGGQLVNQVFSRPHAVFIEVAAMSQGTSPLCSNGRAFAGGWVMSAGRHLPLHNQQPHPGPTAHRSRFAVDWNLSRALANVSARGGRVERNWYFNRDMLVDMPHMRRALELAIRMVCGAAKREAWCAGLPGHGSPAAYRHLTGTIAAT